MRGVKLKNNLGLTRPGLRVWWLLRRSAVFLHVQIFGCIQHSRCSQMDSAFIWVNNFKKLRALKAGCLDIKMHCQRKTHWETLVTKVGKIMSDLLLYGRSRTQFSSMTSPDGKYFLLIQCSMSMHMLLKHVCIHAYTYICSSFYSHWPHL